jgi:hypothetical protein
VVSRRLLLLAVPLALLFSPVAAQTPDKWSWDGTWTGMQVHPPGPPWAASITIANGKVTSYLVRDAGVDIKYSNVTPTVVTFGDRDNYVMKITKTSETTASARVHGRHGSARALLTRQ